MTKVLDPTVKQSVKYAIPLWLRDEQIKASLSLGLPHITMGERRTEPVAIVGYGPSLNETWEKVKEFPYVISCSGAHPFLLERGIVPTYHAAVDPLPGHTVKLIGQPHPAVQYLISSTCHPDVFAHLKDYSVTLWHVFDETEEGLRMLPPGVWSITGGCDIGLRCLTLAAFMGFRDLHVFGLDGSYGADGRRHAGAHPVPLPNAAVTTYDGVEYKTTSGMLEASRQTCHELDMLGPHVTTTFYGEGLTQAMVRKRTPSPKDLPIAASKPDLISVEYLAQQKRLHQDNLTYGVGDGKYAATVTELAKRLDTKSILNYGAGKGYLAKALPFPIWEYDPAIPEKSTTPRPADLVCCFDVLEHIEPDKILFVLDDLRRVTKRAGYFVIHTGPSTKTLADGRNAHILQRHKAWWENRLREFFTIGTIIETPPLLHVIVAPHAKKLKTKAHVMAPA